MLDFSISSVNMAILVSNLFIIFLVLIFRNRKIMFRLGLPLLVGFVILICVRMIFSGRNYCRSPTMYIFLIYWPLSWGRKHAVYAFS